MRAHVSGTLQHDEKESRETRTRAGGRGRWLDFEILVIGLVLLD